MKHTIASPHHSLTVALTPEEQAHSARLLQVIDAAIKDAGGWLDFQSFMELALYAPCLGYYSAGAHKLGEGGDFTTAPEISSLFSRCIARQCAEVLQQLGQGSVLELGAGSGVMAVDMLREFERMGCLPECYYILEVSADLRARQQALIQQLLPQYIERVQWLSALPEKFVGIIVANEVLDALPVQRFCVQQQVQALGVTRNEAGLQWQARDADAALTAAVNQIDRSLVQAWPKGYCSEINTQLPAWIRSVAESLHQGVVLLIDYGFSQAQYYSAERTQGTLSCFFRQRMHDDPFINVGLQDITTWVDFTALAHAGIAADLTLEGFATQAHFLLGCGLDRLLVDMSEQPDAVRWQLSQQVQKLTLPSEMGESFKAMAFSKDCDVQLSGFKFRDLRDRL